jgi:hypothetical protein
MQVERNIGRWQEGDRRGTGLGVTRLDAAAQDISHLYGGHRIGQAQQQPTRTYLDVVRVCADQDDRPHSR